MTLINEEVQKIIEKVLEIIKKQYEGYEIKITGIHIEKILGENEYVVTANFETSKHTRDRTIVMEKKIMFLEDKIKYNTKTCNPREYTSYSVQTRNYETWKLMIDTTNYKTRKWTNVSTNYEIREIK